MEHGNEIVAKLVFKLVTIMVFTAAVLVIIIQSAWQDFIGVNLLQFLVPLCRKLAWYLYNKLNHNNNNATDNDNGNNENDNDNNNDTDNNANVDDNNADNNVLQPHEGNSQVAQWLDTHFSNV